MIQIFPRTGVQIYKQRNIVASEEIWKIYFEKIQNEKFQITNHTIGDMSEFEQGYKLQACRRNLVENHWFLKIHVQY